MAELIENSFALSIHLLKKDIRRARRKEPVDGYVNFSYNGKQTALDYSIEYVDDKPYLVINFVAEPQRILLSEQKLTFGIRAYLTCKCGYKANDLYLINEIFACRKCHKLKYESTTINRNSRHGQLLHRTRQAIKIISKREGISRILYKSIYTKRFNRWTTLCAREGFVDNVEDAKKLLMDIKNQ